MPELQLRGLDGSNPLGFLAAIGTLRLCALRWPTGDVRLKWVQQGSWQPVLSGEIPKIESALCEDLASSAVWAPLEAFDGLGNNLTVTATEFQIVAGQVAGELDSSDRRAADFLAAFGNEVFEDEEKDRINYSDLSFITGSGHQHFLGTAKALGKCAGAAHLQEALFGPWRSADKGNSFRWDPEDAKEYALRWSNPGPVGVWTVWGANRLAFEALPYFPMIPGRKTLRTTGFATRNRAHELTWPIWTYPVSAETVRSLIGLRQLQELEQPRSPIGTDRSKQAQIAARSRQELASMGIGEVFRSRRVRIGQGANFKVSFRPARAV